MQSSGLRMDVESVIDRSLALLGLHISLKEKQREAIRSFVGGDVVFVALPTGYGK